MTKVIPTINSDMEKDNLQQFSSFQEFLDQKQYSRNGILRYEMIFGHHFISTGGRETTEEIMKMLMLEKGERVLDVGCGIGGSAFLMTEEYGASVLGVDLSVNMIDIARERLTEMNELEGQVQFELSDITERDFPEASFDVIYSRDTILHIANKKMLFEKFLHWLKPGGKLFISDYCCSDGEHSEQFKKYVAGRGYTLLSIEAYGKTLEQAGFVKVDAQDRTEQFADILETEIKRTNSIKEDFIEKFSKRDYEDIIGGWTDKLKRVKQGEQRWGVFYALKAMNPLSIS